MMATFASSAAGGACLRRARVTDRVLWPLLAGQIYRPGTIGRKHLHDRDSGLGARRCRERCSVLALEANFVDEEVSTFLRRYTDHCEATESIPGRFGRSKRGDWIGHSIHLVARAVRGGSSGLQSGRVDDRDLPSAAAAIDFYDSGPVLEEERSLIGITHVGVGGDRVSVVIEGLNTQRVEVA